MAAADAADPMAAAQINLAQLLKDNGGEMAPPEDEDSPVRKKAPKFSVDIHDAVLDDDPLLVQVYVHDCSHACIRACIQITSKSCPCWYRRV